jgi:hypothetical protein
MTRIAFPSCVLRDLSRYSMRVLITIGALLLLPGGPALAERVFHPPNSITFFTGMLTGNQWEDFFEPAGLTFRRTYMAGIGYNHRIATVVDALEIEGLVQAAPHFGAAHQWEFDAAANARWTDFPWNDVLPTTLSFALGPSYETQIPREEEPLNGGFSKRWLAFWLFEIEVSPPQSPWSGVIRVHHRSTAFGLFGKGGGSNWLVLGVRRYF